MVKEYLHRKLSDTLKRWLDRREILAIKGPRQSGKTTLLKMLKDYLIFEKKEDALSLRTEHLHTLDKTRRSITPIDEVFCLPKTP